MNRLLVGSRWIRKSVLLGAAAGTMVLLAPETGAAAKMQMYRNEHSIYYCADTCSGSGCCDPALVAQ